jgi:hypothetical protein
MTSLGQPVEYSPIVNNSAASTPMKQQQQQHGSSAMLSPVLNRASSPPAATLGALTLSVAALASEVTSVPVAVAPPPGAPMTTAEVQGLDLHARALVLMRAEKAQMQWETAEARRRGHALPEKVRATSYNVSQELKQAQLSASLSWDRVEADGHKSLAGVGLTQGGQKAVSNAFIHSASPPLAVMQSALDTRHHRPDSAHHKRGRNKYGGSSLSLTSASGGSIDLAADLPLPTELDPAMEAQTIEALLRHSAALSEQAVQQKKRDAAARTASAAAAGAGGHSIAGPRLGSRPLSALKKDANLAASSSPLVRSLLQPLVDSSFTSLFASPASTPGGGDEPNNSSASFFTITRPSTATVTGRLGSTGKLARSTGTAAKAMRAAQRGAAQVGQAITDSARPATAGELGRSASQRSVGHNSPAAPLGAATASFVDRLSAPRTPHQQQARLHTSAGRLGLGSASNEKAYPMLRYAAPAASASSGHDDGHVASPFSSTDASTPSAWGTTDELTGSGAIAAESREYDMPASLKSPYRASKAGMQKSRSAAALSPSSAVRSFSSRASPKRSLVAADDVASGWLDSDGQAGAFDSRAVHTSPNVRASLAAGAAADNAPRGAGSGASLGQLRASELKQPSAGFFGGSPTGSPTAASALYNPLRHTRTTSLGSFRALSNAGVERLSSPVFAASASSASLSGFPATAIDEEQEGAEEQQYGSQLLQVRTHGHSSGGGGQATRHDEESKQQQQQLLSPTRSQNHLSPFASPAPSPNTAAGAGGFGYGSASGGGSGGSSPMFPSSPSAAALGGSPYALTGGGLSALRKTSFVDERRRHAVDAARIVVDAHQAIYSRLSPGGAQLPGTKNAFAGGADGTDLTPDQLEALRRKKLFGIAPPAPRHQQGQMENPSAFAKVIAHSETLPSALLQTKQTTNAVKVRAEEEITAKAARSNALAADILHSFKEAAEGAQI